MNFNSLFAGYSREDVIEAIYFAIRELKQAPLGDEQRKEHYQDSEGSVPSERAVDLSERIISIIEEREGVSVDDMSEETVTPYLDALSDEADRANEAPAGDDDRGKSLLDAFRANPR